MRLSFRLKVFLLLSLAIMFILAMALIGILTLFDRYYDASVMLQYEETGRSIQKIQEEQFATLQPFTRAMNVAKIYATLEEKDLKTLQAEVDAQLWVLKPPCDGVSIADQEGRFVIRAEPDESGRWKVELVPEKADLAERALLTSMQGYFVSQGVLYYGLCRKLEIRDEKLYGYVLFWNRIDREIEKIRSIHPRIGLVYLVNGSPRPFGENVGDGAALVDRTMVVMQIGEEPYSVLSEKLQPNLSRVFKFPLGEKHEFVWKVTRTALGVAVAALVIAVIVSYFISRGLSKPILTLVGATHEIDRGNFKVRVNIRSRDELGLLGTSFNEMAQGLEEREKRKAIMRQTLSADVENELMSTREVTLGGTVAEVTIMFVDIRGFTTMSEGMPPEKVVAMLNEYMTMADRVIQRHNGFVSKFIGDGILALFGAGRKQDQPALDAVRAGRGLLEDLEKLNAVRRGRGEKEIRIGVGINTGEVLKGNVGSQERLEFTVIGEQVNLAARLCSNAKPLQILISESCYAKVAPSVEITRLEPIAVKGFSRPIQVYEVVSIRAPS